MEVPVTTAGEPALDLSVLSRAALVTALAIALPPLFHAVRLGSVFLPMYLPVLAGAFFLPPRWAAVAGASAPLLSAFMTGMPPLFPPIALWMMADLAVASAVVALVDSRLRVHPVASLSAGLAVGRFVQALAVFATASVLDLPKHFLTAASFVASWPGMVLALVSIPAAVTLVRRRKL